MREMKDSGIEWIGEIPKEWKILKGKYLFSQRNTRGNKHNLQLLSPTQNYGVIPQTLYEKLSGMVAVKLNEKTDLERLKTIHKGDFCISLRSFQGGFEFSNYEGVVSPAYQVFYSTDFLCNNYYRYLFKDRGFVEKMNSYTMSLRDGKNISFEDFGNSYIPVPPVREQAIIASFLDSKCTEIDSLTADIQSQIDTLQQYKQSVITEVVTKGLDPDVEMKDSGVEWIGKIPKHWVLSRFKYIATVKANLVSPFLYLSYPQISPENIEKDSGMLLNYTNVEESGVISANHLFHTGQILYSKIRPNLNKVIIAPFTGLCSADMYPIETFLNTRYVYYSMLSIYFVEQVSLVIKDRVKMPKINQEELGNIQIVIPSKDEQNSIVIFLDRKCAEIDDIIAKKCKQLEILADYKKSLIYEYVTGKKEVPSA